MPLKANLKKKTEQEKEQSYTKPKNNVSLPKKTVTTAKQSAQAIKSSVGGKKATYKPSAKKEQEVENRIATKKNFGSEKSDTSYRNTRLGKTSSYTAQSSYKKGREVVKQKAEDTGLYVNKVDTTTPRKKRDNTNPTRGNGRDTSQKKTNRNNYNKHRLDEGAKDIQNRALSGQLNADEPTRYITDVHGRTAVDDRVRVNNLDDLFNVGGKFLSNAMDSAIDYSPVTIPYTLATGETLTNGAYYDNPYEEQRTQGLSAGAGRMAGMALNYGIARSAANPLLEQAANAVMNGTKVGALINNSATLGKIGQAVGTNTAKDIASGLVKETISDATIGAGQNALINYAEGLRGEDFWRQMAKDEALDFAIGGIMEGAGIGKQIGRANRNFNEISAEKATDLLKGANTKAEYIDALIDRANRQMDIGYEEGIAPRLKKVASDKSNEFLEEAAKVDKMTDRQFSRYQQGKSTDVQNPVNRRGMESAKVKAENKPKGSALEAEADAKSWEDFSKTPSKEARAEAKAQGLKGGEELKNYWRNRKMQGFGQNDIKEVSLEDAVKTVKEGLPESQREGWFTKYDSGYKPQIEEQILNDKSLRNAGLNLAYHNYKGTNKNISFEEFLNTPITMYRGTQGKTLIDDDVFVSFTPDRKVAERFGGEIQEVTIKPIDTLGNYQTNGELEYLVPRAKADAAKAAGKTKNVGYHAGDLGKSEWHSQQAGSSRDTGHFGTGTYFVGDEKLIGKGSGYEDRPHHTVDFNDYNLYKPKNAEQGARVHENLKRINRASSNLDNLLKKIDTTDKSISKMRKVVDNAVEYTEANLKKIQKVADDVLSQKEIDDLVREAKEHAKPKTRSDEEYLELAQNLLRKENKELEALDLSRSADESKARLKEIEDIYRSQDKATEPYEKYYFNLLSDKLSNELNGDFASGASKYLDDLESSKNIISQLAEDTGKSETEVRKALEVAREKISKYSDSKAKEDSASTIVMKELGFEGVDVRGIKELDNTEYGSVIYNLNENAVAFPNEKEYNKLKGDLNNGKDAGTSQQEGTEVNRGTYGVLQGRQGNDGVRQELLGDRAKGKNGAGHHKEFLVEDKIKKILDKDETIRTKTSLDYSEDVDGFNEKLGSNRKTAKYGYCVDLISKEDLAEGSKLIVTHDGAVTVGVNPRGKGGNIIGLSKSGNAPSGVTSHEAMMNAIAAGGDRSDQYGQALTNLYNDRYGLVPVAKVKYNEDVIRELSAPEEVEAKIKMFNEMRAEGNEPDVFVSAKFDDLQGTISTRAGKGYKKLTKEDYEKLPVFTDYEKALNYRDEILDSLDKRNAYTKEHGINGTFTEAKATTVEGAKRPTKRLGKKAETVAESTKPQETTKTSNGGDLPKGGKIEKVGEFEVVGGGKGVETTTPTETKLSFIEQLKKTLRNGRRDLINSEAGLERMDKVAKQTKIQEKSYMTRNAKGQAGYILNKKLVDRQGKEIGKSLSEVLGGKIEYNGKTYDSPFKDKATAKLFDEYMFELHNTYRAPQGKNIYGGRDYVEEVDQIIKNYPALAGEKDRLLKWLNDTDGTTSKEQRKALEERLRNKYENFDDVIKDLNKYRAAKSQANVDRILKEHPEFAKVTEEMDKWWGSFTDEYLVKSGIISAKDVKKFKEIYPHYVPTFRDMGEAAGRESKNAATLIKKATGSGKRQLLTVPEQYAHQIDRIVTAARRNELNQEIINTISKDPAGMKAFGAIQDGKGKLTYDFSNGDLDDFITTLDDISLNQIKSGKNTITAVFNGEKVTANISDEVAKSLEAMSNIQDTNLLVKVGKTITNPMKFTITGGNPVFFVSNMMRDLPTLYIQSNHGFVKTTTGLFKATKEVFTNGEKYKMYKALGGAESGYYMRGKGFETTASTRGVIKRVQEVMSFLGEKGEAIPRLAEFINTLEKTGDAYKALRDAAESTVDFSRRGSSDVAKALDAWTLYLNAGLQGLDKFARTVAAHPVRTLGRSATMLGIPYMALTALNQDNPYYQELTERVKQNNFLIPNLAGEKDEDGNCKTFVKVPLNREYGTVFATSLYCALKAARGEDDSWEGFRETFEENFLPNNPFTDNILAPLLINIPQNKDFAGRSIIPNSLKDASPENQYDYSTSEFAKLISKGMNRIPVKDVPIVKYLQSPKLVDYILDSYTGYYGQVLQSATTTGGTSKDNYVKDVLVKQTAEQPFLNKFVADSRYSSKPVEDFYNMKDEYTQQKTDAEIEGKTWSEAHAAEHALSKISKGLYESTQAEKAILADKSLTKAEKDKMIGELRTARNELAKEAKKEVTNAVAEYRQAPTFSELSDTTKEKWSTSLGIEKEQWATAYKKMTDEYDSRKEENEDAKMTADEKRLYLIENGITTYKQAQSILGENTSKNKWDEALAMYRKGETYDSLTTASLEKAERQKDMTETEIKFDDNFRTRADSRYDGKTVSKKMYDNFLYEVQYVDKNTDNNGSIKQSEAQNAIENLDQMYGLTQEQKAYLWYLAENVNSKGEGWKKQPYGKWNG